MNGKFKLMKFASFNVGRYYRDSENVTDSISKKKFSADWSEKWFCHWEIVITATIYYHWRMEFVTAGSKSEGVWSPGAELTSLLIKCSEIWLPDNTINEMHSCNTPVLL